MKRESKVEEGRVDSEKESKEEKSCQAGIERNIRWMK
jgi:hypothetical protein